MTHHSIHSKLLASTFAGLLSSLVIPVGLAGVVTLLSPGLAEASVTSASCRIHAVEATPDGDGTIPKELEFLSDQLQAPEFARYKGFRLVDVKDFKLDVGAAVEKKFKSGHVVKLSLLGGEQDKLDLHTEILRGAGSVTALDFSLKVAQLMLIPVRRSDQAIIFAYQCKT
jgi:hypothetical protein